MTTREQRALLQLVREVSRRQIAPRARRRESGAPFPADVFALLAELDLLGLPFSVEDGGLAQPRVIVCQVLSELSQASLGVGLGTRVHLLATGIVAGQARPALRQAVLPQLTAGEWLAAHALDVHAAAPSPGLRIVRHDDDYVVDGVLEDVTNAGLADCYVILGTPSGRPVDPGTLLLVPAESSGLEASVERQAPAEHGAATGVLRCRSVRVPVGHRLGAEGGGATIVVELTDDAHLGLAACAVGLARAALQTAVACVREHDGPPSPTDPGRDVTSTVVDIAAAIEAADALCARAAVACDGGRGAPGLAAMARTFAIGTAAHAAERAAAVHGDRTCAAVVPLARYRREAAALRLVDGGDDAARRALAHDIVGELRDEGR